MTPFIRNCKTHNCENISGYLTNKRKMKIEIRGYLQLLDFQRYYDFFL